jgi:Xaa-Pro aminopeptidase
MDGTTDVTRTLHFGTPTAEQRRSFTRVLQGHIAIDTAVFPSGTSGRLLVVRDGQSANETYSNSKRSGYNM